MKKLMFITKTVNYGIRFSHLLLPNGCDIVSSKEDDALNFDREENYGYT